MRILLRFVFCTLVAALPPRATAAAGETLVTWHGHAAFEIVTPKGAVLMIDPWLSNPTNPAAQGDADPIGAVKRLDYILITHGHFDHVGDAVALAEKTGARLVTNFELGTNMARVLGYPEKQMGFDTLMNIGGEIQIAGGEVMVALTPAVHSSGLNNPFAKEQDPGVVYGGEAAGIVLRIDGGPTIYDSGDTAFFSDMTLIGRHYRPDIALLNIGGHFGMEPEMAVEAARAVKARWVIPHHYATFPVLTQDPQPFAAAVKKAGMRPLVMKPGDVVRFVGDRLVQ